MAFSYRKDFISVLNLWCVASSGSGRTADTQKTQLSFVELCLASRGVGDISPRL